MDLGFDHDELVARAEKFFSDSFGLFGSGADIAGRNGDTVLSEKLFGLVFVNVHVRKNPTTLNELSALKSISNPRRVGWAARLSQNLVGKFCRDSGKLVPCPTPTP
jgi:hypothetical protein